MQVQSSFSMFQQISSASTPVRELFSPQAAPSKLQVLTAECPRGAVRTLRFRVSSTVKKLDAMQYTQAKFGNLSTRCVPRSDAERNISRFLVKAGSGVPLESSSSKSCWQSFKHGLSLFYRFTKPYVLLGKIIEVLSMSLVAIDKLSDFSALYVWGVLKTMVVAVLMSTYVAGLNQLTDIEIDKVNKPNRPLVSGEYSYKTGFLIVASCAILGFGIAWAEGSWPLLVFVFGTLLMGTVYSVDLPLLRWKRSAFLAAVCMVTLVGVIPPVAHYLHFQTHLLQKPYKFPMSLMFTSAVIIVQSFILALAKDIPDVEGDVKYGIETFTARFGQKKVFWFCVTLLQIVYGAAICAGVMSSNPWSKLVMIVGHSVAAVVLWNRAKQTDITNQNATESFYMFLWKLLDTEYLLTPFVRF